MIDITREKNLIKLHPLAAAGILAALAVVIFLTISFAGGVYETYRQRKFNARQAVLEQQNQAAKAEKDAALQRAAEAAKTVAAAQQQLVQKEDETKQLESELADLERTTATRRQAYNSARNQRVAVRAVGAGVSDAELRADAVRLGLVIR